MQFDDSNSFPFAKYAYCRIPERIFILSPRLGTEAPSHPDRRRLRLAFSIHQASSGLEELRMWKIAVWQLELEGLGATLLRIVSPVDWLLVIGPWRFRELRSGRQHLQR